MANWILPYMDFAKRAKCEIFTESIFQSYLDFSFAKNLNFATDVSQSPGSNLQNIYQNRIFKMATVLFLVQPSTIQSQDTEMTR